MSDNISLEDAPLSDPHEQRVPCVLLLDTSGSMSGPATSPRIDQLNAGLTQFQSDLASNALARKRAEVAVITFGCPDEHGEDVVLVQEFARIDEGFEVPKLKPGGSTPMGRALIMALNEIEQRKGIYKAQGIQYTRPWLFLITDGGPTDGEVFERAVTLAQTKQREKGVTLFAIGVEGADFAPLKRVSPEFTLALKPGFSFVDLFNWFSASVGSAVQSKPGDAVELPPMPGLQVVM